MVRSICSRGTKAWTAPESVKPRISGQSVSQNMKKLSRTLRPTSTSTCGTGLRPHESRNRGGGFGDLGVRLGSATADRVAHTGVQVPLEQLEGHTLPSPRGRRDLGQHVNAVGVLVDHTLEPANLALDAAQPPLHGVLVVGVSEHCRPLLRSTTPVGYQER